jgi:hypothetical protein
MWRRIGRVPGIVVTLAAVGLATAIGLVAANATGTWVRFFRTGTGPICSVPPCPSAPIVVGPATYAVFRPNDDVGLAVGLLVAMVIAAIWLRAKARRPSEMRVSR